LKFLPEIIEEGRLYIAEPPLYELKQKGCKDFTYVATQTEYIEKCIQSVGNITISFPER
jgi:DNA gyrase/topoisomerase IV subunit B